LINISDPQQKEFVEMNVEPVIDFRQSNIRVDQIQNAKIAHSMKFEINGKEAGSLSLHGVPVGKFTEDRTFWKISRINIQANQLQSDLVGLGLVLETGDTLNLKVDLTGTFDIIANGKRYNAIIEGMTYNYEFTNIPKEDLTCPEGQVRENSICVGEDINTGSGGTCEGLTPEECLAQGKSSQGNNKCQTSDPNVPCDDDFTSSGSAIIDILTGLVSDLSNNNSNFNDGLTPNGGPTVNGGLTGFCDSDSFTSILCANALSNIQNQNSSGNDMTMMMMIFVFLIIIVVIVVLAKK